MSALRLRLAGLLVAALILCALVLAFGALWADLDMAERGVAASLLTPPRLGLLGLLALAVAIVAGVVTDRYVTPRIIGARRIAEAVRLVARGNPAHRLVPRGVPELHALAEAINDLAHARSQLLDDVDTTVARARAQVEDERNRLAALIAELDQSVLVCNREGRVLLYNEAASAMLGGQGKDGELLGLGRLVFGVIDRAVILHALEAMERHIERDEGESTHFVTATRDGRLLRVQAAPVLGATPAGAKRGEMTGYVLLLADVTALVDADARRATLFQDMVETTRAALANIRAAIENLTAHPDMDPVRRARFATIIGDESVRLSEHIHRLTAESDEDRTSRWPLEEMRGEDLLTLACSRIARRTGLTTKLDTVDPALWLRVDSFQLAQGLSYVAQRLKEEFGVRQTQFRLVAAGGHAQLDIVWRGPPMSSETAFSWQADPFTVGGEDSKLTLAQVAQRHGGETWYQRDVPSQTAYFRFLLPLAVARSGRTRAESSRPEFYDFDLFSRVHVDASLDERMLREIAYTVFDTETTGLNPAQGDEIIAIGAIRIVNGRLLQGECFESLVDPQRNIGEAAVAIHGLTPAALAGQPTIDEVLPQFHRFAEDTVLVGHNAAFDMRFLQLKEAATHVRFDQPVLDTLLLSAILHPDEESHGLEEIATRLGVAVVGRHTALGDARLTAEVFLRMLPLLAQRGIETLGEARTRSQKSYYARLQY